MRDRIANIIADYEAGKVSFDEASRNIASITGKRVDKSRLDNYWRSESLEALLDELALPALDNWKSITDERALELISEALQNVTGPVFSRNAEALELRYRKPSGYLHDLVFQEAVEAPRAILEHLQRDTVIRL